MLEGLTVGGLLLFAATPSCRKGFAIVTAAAVATYLKGYSRRLHDVDEEKVDCFGESFDSLPLNLGGGDKCCIPEVVTLSL